MGESFKAGLYEWEDIREWLTRKRLNLMIDVIDSLRFLNRLFL